MSGHQSISRVVGCTSVGRVEYPAYVFGMLCLKLTCLPAECVAFKLKQRTGDFTFIYLRFPGRIEKRALVAISDTEMMPADWVMEENVNG